MHFATFDLNQKTYTIAADYPLRFLYNGDAVKVIYESSNPEKAAVYKWWGYWIKLGELAASITLLLVLYFIAASVTKHPTPEALIEELEARKPKMKKRKYMD
ncbi:MAG: hypothetical protein JWN76_2748 [Chitinophagaceae bacterium]|nr:hypothetical protein [Chitinophagaceae bacterium]